MILNGTRINLKPIQESDLEFIYKMSKHPKVYEYEEDKEPTHKEIYNKFYGRISKMEHERDEYYSLLIIIQDTKETIGEIHFHLDNKKTRCWELGYSLHPEYWGNGYATEAVKLAIQFMFENANAHKIIGCCNGKNLKSAKCMERSGMLQEGCIREARSLRGKWCDELVFSILDRDYFINT